MPSSRASSHGLPTTSIRTILRNGEPLLIRRLAPVRSQRPAYALGLPAARAIAVAGMRAQRAAGQPRSFVHAHEVHDARSSGEVGALTARVADDAAGAPVRVGDGHGQGPLRAGLLFPGKHLISRFNTRS